MSRARRIIACAALVAWISGQGLAQSQTQSQAQNASVAKDAASALGQNLRGAISSGVTSSDAPSAVPAYQGSDLPQASYYDAPDKLASAGAAASLTSVGTAITTNPNRATFDPATIDLTNAQAIEASPASYTGGSGAGGSAGKCEPLPASSGTSSTYYDSCQIGQAESDVAFTCHVGWKAGLAASYDYQCHTKWLTLGTTPFAQASDCGDFPIAANCTKIATQDNALGHAAGTSGLGLSWTARQSDDTYRCSAAGNLGSRASNMFAVNGAGYQVEAPYGVTGVPGAVLLGMHEAETGSVLDASDCDSRIGSAFCPDGFTLSDGSCVASSPASTRLTCPTGWDLVGDACQITTGNEAGVASYRCQGDATLSGDKCIASSPANIAGYTCPESYDLSGTQCTRVITAARNPDSYRCPTGQTLSGNTCVYTASSAAVTSTSCPTGWSLEGMLCTQGSSYAASLTYSCLHGGTLSGTDCVTQAASPASASSDCGTTSLQMANGFCMGSVATFSNCSVIAGNLTLDHREIVTSVSGNTVNLWFCYFRPHVTYSCSGGASLSGDQCLTSSTSPASAAYICPSGGTLSGSSCNTASSQNATLVQSCPEGASFDGQLCRQTISTPAEVNWSCPVGYALSGDVCSATETIAATPTYICAEGATLHGGQCQTTSAATPATYACPQGSSLSGSICLQGGSTTPAVTYLCAAGQILSGSNCLTYSAPLTTQGMSCTEPVETCVDSEPATRLVGGVPITRSCWAWQRSYQCAKLTSGNDCGALEAKGNCHFDHEVCLDEACQTKSRVFQCSTPAGPASGESYACSGDIYCLNGDCTQVKREASPDFAQALTAIHAMGDASGQFDQNSLQLFGGEAEGCHKPLFGLVNCCAGKSTGLIAAASGAAALAAGPGSALFAGLVTPLLIQFLCSSEEKLLDVKDRMGQCHYIGEYCSQKLLFVCGSLRKNYCCYASKLARLIQEQGRAQLGKGWGSAKSPACEGFSVEEFARLDLARMDFSEIYADFTSAVSVPASISNSLQIQNRIEAFYQAHQGS